MRVAVDTNVFSDLLSGDSIWEASADRTLWAALELGPLVVCPLIRAELSPRFESPSLLEALLNDFRVESDQFSDTTLWHAGQAWRNYRRRANEQMICPACGQLFSVQCASCTQNIIWRQHLIADFLIGAHAQWQADALITRDQGYYRTYFPDLRLIVPKAE